MLCWGVKIPVLHWNDLYREDCKRPGSPLKTQKGSWLCLPRQIGAGDGKPHGSLFFQQADLKGFQLRKRIHAESSLLARGLKRLAT